MNIVSAKALAIVSLFVLTLLFAVLPIKLSSWATRGGRYQRAMVNLATCFSGGIFLGVALLHLLPEVRETFEYVLCMREIETEYPITELTVGGGFLLILLFEQVVLLFHRPRPSSQCDIANVPPHGCDQRRSCRNCGPDDEDSESVASTDTHTRLGIEDNSETVQHRRGYSPIPNGVKTPIRTLSLDDGTAESCADEPADVSSADRLDLERNDNDDARLITKHRPPSVSVSGQQSPHPRAVATIVEVQPSGRNTPAVAVVRPAGQAPEDKSFSSLVLLAALSLHSLFEGLALGLQSTASSTIQVFVAILFHKCVLAFAMGVRMVQVNSPRKRIVLAAFIFAIMSPLGALIGIAVDATADNEVDRQLSTACLQGIATGTFLFITFLEVIAQEIQGSRTEGDADIQMMKIALTVLGFVAVALVGLSDAGHGHDLECDNHHHHDH